MLDRVSRWSRARAAVLSALVLLAGTGASGAVGLVLHAAAREDAADRMDRATDVVELAVGEQLRRYVDAVQSTAAGLSAHQDLTFQEFVQVTRPLDGQQLAGAHAVSFVVPAGADRIADTQAYWRAHGAPDLVLRPAGESVEHQFSIFSRGLGGNVASPAGADRSAVPAVRAAFEQARRTGRTAVGDPFVLRRDAALPPGQQQLSFIVATPVVEPDDTFRGFLTLSVRSGDFMAGTLRSSTGGTLGVQLLTRDTAGTRIAVADVPLPATRQADLRREVTLTAGQRRWTVRTTGDAQQLVAAAIRTDLLAGVAGLLLSALAALLVHVQASARRRAETAVCAATAELRAELAQRTRAQAQLRTARDELTGQRAYLTQVLDALRTAVVTWDADGRLVHANLPARAGLPTAGAATIGDVVAALGLTLPDGSAPAAEALARCTGPDAGPVHDREMVLSRDGRRCTVMVNVRPLRDGSGSVIGAVGSMYDITALREREADLAAFAGVVAHDLNSPLAAIDGFSELLQDELADVVPDGSANECHAHLGRIRRTVDRMRQLIEDLLAYAAAGDANLRLATVDLRAVVDDVVTARMEAVPAQARDTATPPDVYVGPLPAVHADPGMLRQLFDNLVGNALKYTPPGQPARIDITAQPDADPTRVRIEVADRGIGIPEGQHHAIFAGFHRAHHDAGYAGTGLGLAICVRVVERHGGTIGVLDNPGGGARFCFTLPVAGGAAVGTPGAAGGLAAGADPAGRSVAHLV